MSLRVRTSACLAGLAIGLYGAGLCAQTPAAPTPASPPSAPVATTPADSTPVIAPSPSTVANLAARLTALTPDNAQAYFDLGEEVADEASDAGARDLARYLFVLAYELQQRRPAGVASAVAKNLRTGGSTSAPPAVSRPLGPSVCLALAALADTDEERRWLTALAGALDESAATDAYSSGSGLGPTQREGYALELASALGLARTGDGRKALKLLDKPGVSKLLDRYERLLSPVGLTGGAARVRKLAADWQVCAECRNRRAVRSPEGIKLCPTCLGKPGPRLSLQDVIYQLRMESTLLSGTHRSWAAQIIVDGGAPLRDLDPAELAATYRVDPGRCLWRNGVWTAAASSAQPAQAPTQEAKPNPVPAEPKPAGPSPTGVVPSRSNPT